MRVDKNSYNIVGAGAFGASTALQLKRRFPHARICLFDRQPFPCTLAASWDWNKVIRSDYGDTFSMKLALEALDAWRTDPLFKDFYHQDGSFWISDTPLARNIESNYRKLGVDCDYSLLPVEQGKKTFGGLFEDGDYAGVTDILINRDSGWAEAKEALEKVIQTAVDAGVIYVVADIASLHIVRQGSCYGVKSRCGRIYGAERTLLCTGAGTAKLLADTAPQWDALQVGGRLTAAAICTGFTTLSAGDSTFSGSPVCCQDVLPGGALPPTSERLLKFWVDIPFQNTMELGHGRLVSVPDYEQLPSKIMRDEVSYVKTGIYGRHANHLRMDDYRICWDAITPDENFIISPHPHCKNLYIATGGSFHGFKFMPILGKYIVKMMEGTLEPEFAKAWAWDREPNNEPEGDMWPRREMMDIL